MHQFVAIKKRGLRGPCGSLSSLLFASSLPSSISSNEAYLRSAKLDKQLRARHLCSTDVQGGGNCLFRVLSMSLYGNEKNHSSLRSSISKHTINNRVKLEKALGCSLSDIAIKEIVKSLSITNTWAGEDALLSACNFLVRKIHVYFAVDASSVYAPVTRKSLHHPIALAFYEPGHYKSVSCDNSGIYNNKYTVVSRTESARQLHLSPITESE